MATTMAIAKLSTALFAIVSLIDGGLLVGARAHDAIAGDLGWDASADRETRPSGTTLRAGDEISSSPGRPTKLGFTNGSAEGKITEQETKTEYDSCDLSNPIRTYADGAGGIRLHGDELNYIVSRYLQSCQNRLKLPAEVTQMQRGDDEPVNGRGPSPSPSGTALLDPNRILAVTLLCTFLFY